MGYYFSKIIDEYVLTKQLQKVTEALKAEGFGILTEIDYKSNIEEKA